MHPQKWTEKALKAVERADALAIGRNLTEMLCLPLLWELMEQKGGLIPQIFSKRGDDPSGVPVEMKEE